MKNKKLVYLVLAFLIFVAVALGFIIFSLKKESGITVTFLDVGQGDAILIEEGSNQVLIDGGRSGKIILEKLGKHIPFWDRKIETIIVTHPDADHYGGLAGVLNSYNVKNIIKTGAEKDNKEWKNFEEKIIEEGAENIRSIYGLNLVFKSGARLQTIYPFENIESTGDSNDSSVVMRLDFGENSFLFTGDIPVETERILAHSGMNLDVDVLKMAHHGSRNSTGDVFLEKTSPEDVVISVGENNSYKHPHKEVLDKLKNRLVRIWRTDWDGDIIYKCKNIEDRCEVFAI